MKARARLVQLILSILSAGRLENTLLSNEAIGLLFKTIVVTSGRFENTFDGIEVRKFACNFNIVSWTSPWNAPASITEISLELRSRVLSAEDSINVLAWMTPILVR